MTEPELSPNENVPPRLPPPRGAASMPVKRLYRDPSGPLGGVAAGMAGYFGVDPVLVRLLWLVALFSGIGFFAYLMFWVIVPKAPVWPPPGYPSSLGPGAEGDGVSGALISGLFIVALAAVLGSSFGGVGDFVLPVALIGLGVYLLNQRGGELAATGRAQAPAGETAVREQTEPASLPRFSVTRLVLSALALLAGLGWILHSAGVIALSFTLCVAVALIVVGLGSIASLWLGRARGLIALGIALGAGLLVASAVEPWFAQRPTPVLAIDGEQLAWSVGELTESPRSLADLADEYSLGMGELKLDLSQLDLEGTTEHVRVRLGVGDALILVPEDVSLEINGKVGVGRAEALDVANEGMGQTVKKLEEGPAPGRLSIDFQVGVGEGKVRRGSN